jgi:hypothetical protein
MNLPLPTTRPRQASELPSALIDELARGQYDPVEVASWFGFSEAEWERLAVWPPLTKAVAAKKAEYDRDGLSTQLKARMMYGAALDRAFLHAMKDDASFRSIMDFLQHTSEVGDVKPKKAEQQAGQGFTINIQFPSTNSPTNAAKPVYVDVTPTSGTAGDPFENMPTYISAVSSVESLDYVDVAP